ncbi:hypothetical protein F4820DRAFT_302200 [Hypoxylon rubiginosum]|uniref:Uncharacterized protein n=1 Tax=Hypoxylon rubiginosum TaxID=110542 RepID=A0ACB9Z0I6_9PEZI|nr:hypothetical protein F4820DRAFT_302200 [Hypoxylon rubiginosum]
MDYPSTREIRRKPVPSAKPFKSSTLPPPIDDNNILDDLIDGYLESPSPRRDDVSSLKINELKIDIEPPPSYPPRQLSTPLVSSPSEISLHSSTTTSENLSSNRSIWKTAFDETVYFAGGLISHPFESTKHYSILRHSAGVVFYRGPSTSIAISILSDGPLPADRSFWLQRKGFSGNMGMAASALLRTQGSWIDVTPSFEALPSDVPESDERAWQRDIKKFLKKAASHKNLSKQILLETCVIRIPASAEDGYLRIVMCTGEGSKKVLCPSPVFRIASTSSDVSVLRGASLTTMPLELGLKVASIVGQNTVDRFVGPARGVIQSRIEQIQSKVDQYKPGLIAQEAGMMAYEKSGLGTRTVSLEESFDAERDVTYDPFHTEGGLEPPPPVIGPDSGPEKPFPIRLTGKVVQGTGQSRTELGMPTANLAGVPSDLLLRLSGVYIGWAAVQPNKALDGISHDWHEAIITVGPSLYAPPRVVAKNVVTVYIIYDFGGATFFNTNLKVVIMAYLRPVPRPDGTQPRTGIAADIIKDINTAVVSLGRENWQCDMTLHRVKTEMSARSIEERYVDMRSQVQKRVDSVPLHLAGFRTARAELKDQAHGRGGLYIRR